jgi:hypothetical protein
MNFCWEWHVKNKYCITHKQVRKYEHVLWNAVNKLQKLNGMMQKTKKNAQEY